MLRYYHVYFLITSENLLYFQQPFFTFTQIFLRLFKGALWLTSGRLAIGYSVFFMHRWYFFFLVLQAESEKLVGDLFEEEHSERLVPLASANHIPMVGPDAGFINMLRYGLLALRLLPESSSSSKCSLLIFYIFNRLKKIFNHLKLKKKKDL